MPSRTAARSPRSFPPPRAGRAAGAALVASALLLAGGGCLDEDGGVEDGAAEGIATDGKADGQALTEAEVFAVLRVANEADPATLTGEVGLSARVAGNVARYRAGADGRPGTADDQRFDSLAELDAVPYVGPRAFARLLAHGRVDPAMLGRHDVSVLFPLPAAGEDALWPASTPARGGALLPAEAFARIGRSLVREVPDDQEYDALRVVALRVDPCFQTRLGGPCQPQARLVFQTLGEEGTNDGAVHALYNLDDADFDGLVAGLRDLRRLAPENGAERPLGVSPALAAQGVDGPYGAALRELIASRIGAANLARMTFVTRTDARQGSWAMGGFHLQAREATGFPAPGPIKIPGASKTIQNVSNAGFFGFSYGVAPGFADPAGRPGLDQGAIAGLPEATRAALRTWATTQLDPARVVPDTADCASCHLAGHVFGALAAADPALARPDGAPRLVGGSDATGDNLRTFGYFGRDPQVAARAANETAAVVAALAAR